MIAHIIVYISRYTGGKIVRNSIGYKNLNIQTVTDLKKIPIEDNSIEFLCGEMGSGKTFATNKYFKSLEDNCIYLSDLPAKIYNDKDFMGVKVIDATTIVNISGNEITSLFTTEKIMIYNFGEIGTATRIIFEQIKNYCASNKTLLIIDIADILMYFELLKDVTSPMIVTLTTVRNSNIYKQITDIKNTVKIPVEISYINYIKEYKLNELEFNDNFANCSGDISLRIPKSLHLKLLQESKVESISLNQYLLYVISRRNSKEG